MLKLFQEKDLLLSPSHSLSHPTTATASATTLSSSERERERESSTSSALDAFLRLGKTMEWVIESIYPTEIKLSPSLSLSPSATLHGILHISSTLTERDYLLTDNMTLQSHLQTFPLAKEERERSSIHSLHPFYGLKVGDKIDCQAIHVRREKREKKAREKKAGGGEREGERESEEMTTVYLQRSDSLSPSLSSSSSNNNKMLQIYGKNEITTQSLCVGVISRLNYLSLSSTSSTSSLSSVTLSLSPYINTDLPLCEISSTDLSLASLFQERCYVGMKVIVGVVSVNKKERESKKDGEKEKDGEREKDGEKEKERESHKVLTSLRVSRLIVESLLLSSTSSSSSQEKEREKESKKGKKSSSSLSLSLSPFVGKDIHSLSIPDSLFQAYHKIEEGQIMMGMLSLSSSLAPKPPAFVISLPGHRFGRLCITEIADQPDWVDLSVLCASLKKREREGAVALALPNGLQHGSFVQCRVLSVSSSSSSAGSIEVSIRKSRLMVSMLVYILYHVLCNYYLSGFLSLFLSLCLSLSVSVSLSLCLSVCLSLSVSLSLSLSLSLSVSLSLSPSLLLSLSLSLSIAQSQSARGDSQ
jgi:hypothetical protein